MFVVSTYKFMGKSSVWEPISTVFLDWFFVNSDSSSKVTWYLLSLRNVMLQGVSKLSGDNLLSASINCNSNSSKGVSKKAGRKEISINLKTKTIHKLPFLNWKMWEDETHAHSQNCRISFPHCPSKIYFTI